MEPRRHAWRLPGQRRMEAAARPLQDGAEGPLVSASRCPPQPAGRSPQRGASVGCQPPWVPPSLRFASAERRQRPQPHFSALKEEEEQGSERHGPKRSEFKGNCPEVPPRSAVWPHERWRGDGGRPQAGRVMEAVLCHWWDEKTRGVKWSRGAWRCGEPAAGWWRSAGSRPPRGCASIAEDFGAAAAARAAWLCTAL